MCEDCNRMERDAVQYNKEQWEYLLKAACVAEIIFVTLYGTPVKVTVYDYIQSVTHADKSKPCPEFEYKESVNFLYVF